MSKSGHHSRNYWVWITKPEYYLDSNDKERAELDPEFHEDDLGWWTCHRDTRAGDLVLLYRTRPKSDLAYLIEAKGDARLLEASPLEDGIYQSHFRSLYMQICQQHPKLEDLRIEINELDAELTQLDNSSNAILSKAKTSEDRNFLREWTDLLEASDQIKLDRDDYAAQQIEGLDEIPDGLAERVVEMWKPKWNELEERFQDFRRRAEPQSPLFLEFFKVFDRILPINERHKSHVEDFDRQVFLIAGLPEDTVVEDDPEFAGSYVCDWIPRYKFERPLPLQELKADSYLSKEWNALRASFKGRSFRMNPEIWSHLVSQALPENPGLLPVLGDLEASRVSEDIVTEKEVENYLRDHLEILEPEFTLELHGLPDGRDGQQYPCPDAGGFIDLLCVDKNSGGFVVIELKSKRAGRDVAGQIKTYMGWVREKLAGGNEVRGLIISKGYDRKLKYALSDMPLVRHLDLSEVWPPR